jgi:hypothetical protein
MKFTFSIWKLKITLDLFDLDTSDKDIKFGIVLSW